MRTIRDADRQFSPEVLSILDAAWCELQRVTVGGVRRFHVPEISEEEASRRSAVGQALQARIRALAPPPPGSPAAAAVAVASLNARRWSDEATHYWTAFESGGWFKSIFAPTGDGLGRLVTSILNEFDKRQPDEPSELEAWMHGIAALARVVHQLAERTRGQAERGIFMPRALHPSAVNLVLGMRRQVTALKEPGFASQKQRFELRRRMAELDRAFMQFEELLSGDYATRCSPYVGIAQYPDGADAYLELIYQNTTLSMSPEEVHAQGLEEVATIFDQMKQLSSRAGFGGDVARYRTALDVDPRWRAESPEAISGFFQRYIDRMDTVALRYFHSNDLPRARHGAEALPPVLEETMAYGYYDQPRPDRATGLYLFNATNLARRSLIDVGAFTFHELVPGHHVHCMRRPRPMDFSVAAI